MPPSSVPANNFSACAVLYDLISELETSNRPSLPGQPAVVLALSTSGQAVKRVLAQPAQERCFFGHHHPPKQAKSLVRSIN
mmetsp:Transcript_8420/g.23942  ORF Transcript_8420/g.23942 Transcript_8420/m.23942 type:complete len:81 (+) Transcript_8420:1042-1284(+)